MQPVPPKPSTPFHFIICVVELVLICTDPNELLDA